MKKAQDALMCLLEASIALWLLTILARIPLH